MKIKIDGKDKEFKIGFISARMFKRTVELQEKAKGKDVDLDLLDELVDYIVQVYGNKFTADEFYDGVDVSEIFPIYADTAKKVIEKFQSKISQFPNE